MALNCYMRGDPVNYLLTLRNADIPSELITSDNGHEVTEVRAWVTVSVRDRWTEVECLCGAVSRKGGPQDYLSLAQAAWEVLCGAREAVSA